MRNDVVITDGEKLKALRDKYKLKQSDLAGSDITRNLLSEIETGKAIITKNVAEIVIKNLKSIANKEGFKITETVEYLTENTSAQAEKILDGYITKLRRLLISKDESFIESLKAAKSFLADWNINEKATVIYELAGDYYYIQNEMYESILYYEKALTAIGKLLPSRELLQIFSKILTVYIHAGNYDKAIESYTFVIDHFDNLSSKDIFHFTYNRGLVFKKLGKYKLALADIERAEGFLSKNDLQNYFIVLDTKAACLYSLQHYEEALDLYNKLLNLLDKRDFDRRLVVCINITQTYLAQAKTENAIVAFKTVQDELPFLNNSKYEAYIYFETGNIYKDLNDTEEAYKYYNKALSTAKEKKDYVLLNTVLETMLENTSNIEIANLIKDELFELITKQGKLSERLIHKLLIFYGNVNDINNIREISYFALKFVA